MDKVYFLLRGNFNLKKKSLYADIALLIVAIVWGAGFVASKEALEVAKPLYILAIRFSLSFILMSIIFFKHLKKINKDDLKAGLIIGSILFLAFATQTIGLQYTQASTQAFLTGTNVVMVPFLYWAISKKKPDIYSVSSAILSLIGIALLTVQGGFTLNIGDALTLVCAFFFACHIVAVGYFAQKKDPIILTILQFGVAAVFSIVLAVFNEPFPINITFRGGFSLIYLGLFSTLIAFLLQTMAQKHTSSSHTAIILCTESVFGSLLSVLILKETFTISMIIGSILVFIGIIVSETKLEFLKKRKSCT
ncbi:DMT family transporter [Clostridium cadaveris]|nr:DMT family transporter [Clostridium cadaveris]